MNSERQYRRRAMAPIPTYAVLCEAGTFLGRDGFDEVYELDGRRFAVAEDPSSRETYPFYVYPWDGDPARLPDAASRVRGKSAA
jgi:hypothetical protein